MEGCDGTVGAAKWYMGATSWYSGAASEYMSTYEQITVRTFVGRNFPCISQLCRKIITSNLAAENFTWYMLDLRLLQTTETISVKQHKETHKNAYSEADSC